MLNQLIREHTYGNLRRLRTNATKQRMGIGLTHFITNKYQEKFNKSKVDQTAAAIFLQYYLDKNNYS